MFGMALVAVLISVNFAACSSENDPTEEKEEVISQTKKIVEIKRTDAKGSSVFSYDEKNRLIKYECGESPFDYTWGNNVIIKGNTTYYLKDDLIIKHSYEGRLIYNSFNQLITYGLEDGHSISTGSYIWENGNVTEATVMHYNIKINYSNKTCKGHFPLMAVALFENNINYPQGYYEYTALYMAHPELVGIKTKNLPNKISTFNDSMETVCLIEYTFTQDGYIESCTVEETQVYHGEKNKRTIIYTFKWQ